jgi:hypothetical protein
MSAGEFLIPCEQASCRRYGYLSPHCLLIICSWSFLRSFRIFRRAARKAALKVMYGPSLISGRGRSGSGLSPSQLRW